jgi:predicted ATP-binding protein involved in virulence
MKLKNIAIKNFRCFEEIELDFGSKTTVFIGKNGTGKSNILSAIRRGMSFMFAEDSKIKNDINSLKANNNSAVRRFEPNDTRIDSYKEGGFCWPTSIQYKTTFNKELIEWEFYKKGISSRLDQSFYKDAKNKVLNELNNEKTFPLLAFFADSYPHKEMNVGKNAKELVKLKKMPKDFGYYGWDEHVNCNNIWFSRFLFAENLYKENIDRINNLKKTIENHQNSYNSSTDLEEFKDRLDELKIRESNIINSNQALNQTLAIEKNYIAEKIIKFTQPLSENRSFINDEFEIIEVYSSHTVLDKKPKIVFQFKNGKSMNIETMPMGYKRLLSIVFDLSYRSFILNGNDLEPEGIVMIDEIELHLHPTLQQDVLERFTRTFPKIQFIITTHSPLVISNFRVDNDKNKLIKLENNNNIYTKEYVENIYGLDYSTNLSEVMEIAPRSSTIDKYINAYLFLFRKEKVQEANKMLDKLKDYLGGDIPKLLQKEIETQKAKIQ